MEGTAALGTFYVAGNGEQGLEAVKESLLEGRRLALVAGCPLKATIADQSSYHANSSGYVRRSIL
jgi:hypothetical protein